VRQRAWARGCRDHSKSRRVGLQDNPVGGAIPPNGACRKAPRLRITLTGQHFVTAFEHCDYAELYCAGSHTAHAPGSICRHWDKKGMGNDSPGGSLPKVRPIPLIPIRGIRKPYGGQYKTSLSIAVRCEAYGCRNSAWKPGIPICRSFEDHWDASPPA